MQKRGVLLALGIYVFAFLALLVAVGALISIDNQTRHFMEEIKKVNLLPETDAPMDLGRVIDLKTEPIVNHRDTTDYLQEIFALLSQKSSIGTDSHHFRLTVAGKQQEGRAFSLPDGTIVVGTAELLEARTEAEIAFIFGHEAGHIIHRDFAVSAARRKKMLKMRDEVQSQNFFTRLAFERAADTVFLSGYLQSQVDADRFALEVMGSAGYDGSAVLGVIQEAGQLSKNRSDLLREKFQKEKSGRQFILKAPDDFRSWQQALREFLKHQP
ncbi:MAG: M48 family metalloprotease [bacterium]|nr:M48 family metalloprotease [bacterium]